MSVSNTPVSLVLCDSRQEQEKKAEERGIMDNSIVQTLLKKYSVLLKPIVTDIEGKTETTRDHYGDYLAFISRATKDATGDAKRKCVQFWALALTLAGANRQGVMSAVNLMGIESPTISA